MFDLLDRIGAVAMTRFVVTFACGGCAGVALTVGSALSAYAWMHPKAPWWVTPSSAIAMGVLPVAIAAAALWWAVSWLFEREMAQSRAASDAVAAENAKLAGTLDFYQRHAHPAVIATVRPPAHPEKESPE